MPMRPEAVLPHGARMPQLLGTGAEGPMSGERTSIAGGEGAKE